MIDEILENNRRFVAGKGYKKHITDGKPSGKTLVVTCMDTRLSVMLPEALDGKHLKRAPLQMDNPFAFPLL